MYVSVVIPVYNSSLFVSKAIESIYRQSLTGSSVEILLVDDCSDDIEDLKTLLRNEHPNVKLIEKNKKSNAADSRNIGFLNSTGDFVFFLDSDDELHKNAIEHRLALHKESKAGVIFGNFLLKKPQELRAFSLPDYQGGDIRDYIFIQQGDFRSSSVSISKKHHKGTLFDPFSQKHQDWIFGIRCYDNNEKILFDKICVAIVNIERSGRMSSSMNIDASAYFCSNYLMSLSHKSAFSKKHWVSAIEMKDALAMKYFAKIFSPRTPYEYLMRSFFLVFSYPFFISFASKSIRFIKYFKYLFPLFFIYTRRR